MNKNMKKTLKIGIVLLIIIAIIVALIIYKIYEDNKNKEITLNNLPELQYTEEQAKEFYTKTLIEYLEAFQNEFHIKYIAETTSEDGEKTTRTEEISKKGEKVAVYYQDTNDRVVIDNKIIYYVDEDNYTVARVKNGQELNTNIDMFFYSLESINDCFVKTGNEILNDVKYYFEEYEMERDNSILIRYYFDENNNMKYIKTYKENSQVQTFFTIEMFEKRIFDFMFDLSDKYEMYDSDSVMD